MYFKTKEALVENNLYSMSVKEVLGRGKQSTEFKTGDGKEIITEVEHPFVAKKMLEIFCRDEDLDLLVKTVLKVNQSGHSGDGKIFVVDIEDGIRIRTGETGINSIM
jgi:nitrogen regulatory protein PII 2